MASFRSFPVQLPSGVRYWTVVDGSYRVVPEVDDFLLHYRLGRGCAESTCRAYGSALVLFFEWCDAIEKRWQDTGPYLGRFVYWLQYYRPGAVTARPAAPVRGARRVNSILAGVRSFFRHGVACGLLPRDVLTALYDSFEDYWMPGEPGRDMANRRIRPRHRLSEPEPVVDNATDVEVLGLVRAARTARDRFIVIAMWRLGLRRGELAGMRRSDVHFVPDAARLGCGHRGTHLHVVRRENANGAWAKSRRQRVLPADWLTVQAYDHYVAERSLLDATARSDFLLVNLFAAPVGVPMHPGGVNDLLGRLSKRAGLTRSVHPHMLRHSFATNVADAGGTVDEIRTLLGHAWLSSSQIYLHPSERRLRAVVDRMVSPRVDATAVMP